MLPLKWLTDKTLQAVAECRVIRVLSRVVAACTLPTFVDRPFHVPSFVIDSDGVLSARISFCIILLRLHSPAKVVDSSGRIVVAVLKELFASLTVSLVIDIVPVVHEVPVPIIVEIILIEMSQYSSLHGLPFRDPATFVLVHLEKVHY